MRIALCFLMALLTFILISCSEDAESLQSVSHPQEWSNPQAENFHGNKVYAAGLENCQSCHGLDYSGGESGIACSGSGCHNNFPHPDGWILPGSGNFHGTQVLAEGLEECQSCHGEDYAGGNSGIACSLCHSNFPHPEGWDSFKEPNSHDTYLVAQNWDLAECTSCHGTDYLGGNSGASCAQTGCHVQTGGPEACNNCHGDHSADVRILSTWAPPEDLSGNINTTFVGVGAHQTHINDTTWSTAYARDCGLCHRDPTAFDDPDHIDTNPGRNIQFGDIAISDGAGEPEWVSGSTSCENVYCHGNFRFRASESANAWAYSDSVIVGNNPEMIWTNVDGIQDACGTCHGLPPQGHLNIPTCSSCHGNVVDADNNIIDKKKHINGQIDLSL